MEVKDDIQTWDDFCQVFNNVCSSLIERDLQSVVLKLKNAKSWVDDPSYEWFEFWYSIDYIIDDEAELFSVTEYKSLKKLSRYLEQHVPNKHNA